MNTGDAIVLDTVKLFKFFFTIFRLSEKMDLTSKRDGLNIIKSVGDELGIPLVKEGRTILAKEDMLVFIPKGTQFLEIYEDDRLSF